MINIVKKGIKIIYPKYTNYGDITAVITDTGEKVYYETTIESFISRLQSFYSIDRAAERKKYRDFGIRQNPPIRLGDTFYIKYRSRVPVVKGDSAYGYIRIEDIRRIDKTDICGDYKVVYYLFDGTEIAGLETYLTACVNYCDILSISQRFKDKPY